VVTLGIDCQADRVEWQAVAWGRDYRRHVIDTGIITGHIKEPNTMAALDQLVGMSWRHESGRMIAIDRTAIDGNAWTEDVWAWARRHPASRVMMVRGVGHEAAPRLMKVRKERSRTGQLLKYAGRFYNMGTSPMKMALYRNLTKTDPLAYGYVSFPMGLEDEYFRQLTAESRKPVRRRDGFTVWQWVKDPAQRNEMLDTMVQAEAAAEHLGVFVMGEKHWSGLEATRAAPLQDAQMDLEDLMRPVTPQQVSAAPVTARKPGRKVRSKGLS
jgi:phage terminase large subunit GpA-like protein